MNNILTKITGYIDEWQALTWIAPLILRLGIGFAFVWFGYSGLTNTEMWVRLVPAWALALGSAATMVKIHGAIELIFGLILISGYYVRIAAIVLFLSILHTVFIVSGPTRIRDIAIASAVLYIALDRRWDTRG